MWPLYCQRTGSHNAVDEDADLPQRLVCQFQHTGVELEHVTNAIETRQLDAYTGLSRALGQPERIVQQHFLAAENRMENTIAANTVAAFRATFSAAGPHSRLGPYSGARRR